MAHIFKGVFGVHSVTDYIFINVSKELNSHLRSFCEQTFHGMIVASWKLIKYWTSELIKYRISLCCNHNRKEFLLHSILVYETKIGTYSYEKRNRQFL